VDDPIRNAGEAANKPHSIQAWNSNLITGLEDQAWITGLDIKPGWRLTLSFK
jgi:hypothetical protein